MRPSIPNTAGPGRRFFIAVEAIMTSIISVLPMAPDWATIMLITSLMTPPCRSIMPACHGASVVTTLEVAEYLPASVESVKFYTHSDWLDR